MDFSPAVSGSYKSMMKMWERLPAAIETVMLAGRIKI
jgi:hypothetical protein